MVIYSALVRSHQSIYLSLVASASCPRASRVDILPPSPSPHRAVVQVLCMVMVIFLGPIPVPAIYLTGSFGPVPLPVDKKYSSAYRYHGIEYRSK